MLVDFEQLDSHSLAFKIQIFVVVEAGNGLVDLRQHLSEKPPENLFEGLNLLPVSAKHMKIGLEGEPKVRVERIGEDHEGLGEKNTGQTHLIFTSSKISA